MGGFEGIKRPRLAAEIRISKALQEMKSRGVQDDNCPRCGTFDWNVDLLEIPVNSELTQPRVPGGFSSGPLFGTSALNVLSIICKNCGYTMFHTLNVLENPKR
jgi:predicted nucleic-acid-binding Zn-ribbon protein